MYNSSLQSKINEGDIHPLRQQLLKSIKQNIVDLNLNPYNQAGHIEGYSNSNENQTQNYNSLPKAATSLNELEDLVSLRKSLQSKQINEYSSEYDGTFKESQIGVVEDVGTSKISKFLNSKSSKEILESQQKLEKLNKSQIQFHQENNYGQLQDFLPNKQQPLAVQQKDSVSKILNIHKEVEQIYQKVQKLKQQLQHQNDGNQDIQEEKVLLMDPIYILLLINQNIDSIMKDVQMNQDIPLDSKRKNQNRFLQKKNITRQDASSMKKKPKTQIQSIKNSNLSIEVTEKQNDSDIKSSTKKHYSLKETSSPLSSDVKSQESCPRIYEELIQQLESDIRKHIRIQHQLKLHIESVEDRVEELERQLGIEHGLSDSSSSDILNSKPYKNKNSEFVQALQSEIKSQKNQIKQLFQQIEDFKEQINDKDQQELIMKKHHSELNQENKRMILILEDQLKQRNIDYEKLLKNQDILQQKNQKLEFQVNQIKQKKLQLEKEKEELVNQMSQIQNQTYKSHDILNIRQKANYIQSVESYEKSVSNDKKANLNSSGFSNVSGFNNHIMFMKENDKKGIDHNNKQEILNQRQIDKKFENQSALNLYKIHDKQKFNSLEKAQDQTNLSMGKTSIVNNNFKLSQQIMQTQSLLQKSNLQFSQKPKENALKLSKIYTNNQLNMTTSAIHQSNRNINQAQKFILPANKLFNYPVNGQTSQSQMSNHGLRSTPGRDLLIQDIGSPNNLKNQKIARQGALIGQNIKISPGQKLNQSDLQQKQNQDQNLNIRNSQSILYLHQNNLNENSKHSSTKDNITVNLRNNSMENQKIAMQNIGLNQTYNMSLNNKIFIQNKSKQNFQVQSNQDVIAHSKQFTRSYSKLNQMQNNFQSQISNKLMNSNNQYQGNQSSQIPVLSTKKMPKIQPSEQIQINLRKQKIDQSLPESNDQFSQIYLQNNIVFQGYIAQQNNLNFKKKETINIYQNSSIIKDNIDSGKQMQADFLISQQSLNHTENLQKIGQISGLGDSTGGTINSLINQPIKQNQEVSRQASAIRSSQINRTQSQDLLNQNQISNQTNKSAALKYNTVRKIYEKQNKSSEKAISSKQMVLNQNQVQLVPNIKSRNHNDEVVFKSYN